MKKSLKTLANLPRTLSLIWTAGKYWTVTQIILLILRGVLPAGLVYITKSFVDALVLTINAPQNSENIYALIQIGTVFAVLILANELLSSFIQMIYAAHAEKLQDHIFELIHEKSTQIDLAFYEQPEFFDHLHRARSEARNRPIELTAQLGSFLQNGVTLIAMTVVLLRFGWWLPTFLIISALPAFYVVLLYNLRLHSWQKQKTVEERRVWYQDWLLTSGENAAELRLFDLGPNFRRKFVELKGNLRKERLRLAVNQRVAEFFASLIALILSAAAFVWIVSRTIQGVGTLGDLALFYQAFNQGQNLARMFLLDAGKIYANSLFIGDLFEFLALEPKIVNPSNPVSFPQSLRHGINFEQVSFRYQNNRRLILENFDLFIPAGKITAIVGENGSGKSTLIKLLCRFYEAESGSIKFDETDISRFSLETLRRNITVLFQTPVNYSATVEENIRFGDIEGAADSAKIEAAAQSAGASEIIEKLPGGFGQMLGHWFPDGTELSGGEWQRLALARAFLRETPVVLLDEPTSAMDPWAEADWLKRLIEKAAGKTVLLITHRFTTAMRADLIYVMEKGKIIESGTHEELLSKENRYAQSWREQTQK